MVYSVNPFKLFLSKNKVVQGSLVQLITIEFINTKLIVSVFSFYNYFWHTRYLNHIVYFKFYYFVVVIIQNFYVLFFMLRFIISTSKYSSMFSKRFCFQVVKTSSVLLLYQAKLDFIRVEIDIKRWTTSSDVDMRFAMNFNQFICLNQPVQSACTYLFV